MATRELDGPPGTGVLLAKAALRAALRRPPVPRRRSGGPAPAGRPGELPDVELVLPRVRVDARHLAAYARVCGFGPGGELPATYPHVLAFPLALRLMTAGDFPFPLLGLVHVANAITVARPLSPGEPLALRVRAGGLRPHRRGWQFDLVHEATAGGEPVWRDVSTYLRRERHRAAAPAPDTASGTASGTAFGDAFGDARDDAPGGPAGAATLWRLGGDTGRRYAAASGDRNPIHLHALAARAFGFRHAIAHGMWLKARCLAELAGRLPAAYTVEVAFTRPVPLPATVAFAADRDAGGGWRFAVRGPGRPHLTGEVIPA